jgi:hypothetical protein
MVPSDLHFIIRHGLTGFMFLIFVLFGIWNVELWVRSGCVITPPSFGLQGECTIGKLLLVLAHDGPSLFILVICVIIGISLQGAQMLSRYRRGEFFTDFARTEIADRIRCIIQNNPDICFKDNYDSSNKHSLHQERMEDAVKKYPDSVYVWVYHSSADPQLIEWARRRRSYHYLGYHFFTAFLLGSAFGYVIALLLNFPLHIRNTTSGDWLVLQITIQVTLLGLSGYWAYSAFRLSGPMKQEADSMELAWSLGTLYPNFKKKVFEE